MSLNHTRRASRHHHNPLSQQQPNEEENSQDIPSHQHVQDGSDDHRLPDVEVPAVSATIMIGFLNVESIVSATKDSFSKKLLNTTQQLKR